MAGETVATARQQLEAAEKLLIAGLLDELSEIAKQIGDLPLIVLYQTKEIYAAKKMVAWPQFVQINRVLNRFAFLDFHVSYF